MLITYYDMLFLISSFINIDVKEYDLEKIERYQVILIRKIQIFKNLLNMIIPIYSVKIKNTRGILGAALIGDVTGIIISTIICSCFFGQ